MIRQKVALLNQRVNALRVSPAYLRDLLGLQPQLIKLEVKLYQVNIVEASFKIERERWPNLTQVGHNP